MIKWWMNQSRFWRNAIFFILCMIVSVILSAFIIDCYNSGLGWEIWGRLCEWNYRSRRDIWAGTIITDIVVSVIATDLFDDM